MTRLPSRTYSNLAAVSTLMELKKGGRQALGEFIWQHQERFYAVAYMAVGKADVAENITAEAFHNALQAIYQLNPKQLNQGFVWGWLLEFIVGAVANYHKKNSPSPSGPATDPSADGSGQMDWETTVVLGVPRVKRCVFSLPEEQKKVFLLRHQLGLNLTQVAMVLNEHQDNVMAWLHRARVQVVKCLGRG